MESNITSRGEVHFDPDRNLIIVVLDQKLDLGNMEGWLGKCVLSSTPFGPTACLNIALKHRHSDQLIQVRTMQKRKAAASLANGQSLDIVPVQFTAKKKTYKVAPGPWTISNNGDIAIMISPGVQTLCMAHHWKRFELPQQHPLVSEMRDVGPVCFDKIENDRPQKIPSYLFNAPLTDDLVGAFLWFSVVAELPCIYGESNDRKETYQQAIDKILNGLGSASLEKCVETIREDPICRSSSICAAIAWWILRNYAKTKKFTIFLPDVGNVHLEWQPNFRRLSGLLSQLSNIWEFFGSHGHLGQVAFADSRFLRTEASTQDLFDALIGTKKRLEKKPTKNWAFAQLFLEGVCNQRFPVPDGLCIQVSDHEVQEVRLWYDGHGTLIAAVGVMIECVDSDEEELSYLWIQLEAFEGIVKANVSFCKFSPDAHEDDPHLPLSTLITTVVAAAFRDAVVLEEFDYSTDREPPTPGKSSPFPSKGNDSQNPFLFARRKYRHRLEQESGWMNRASNESLRDAGVIKKNVVVEGYFVTYYKGQRPDPARQEKLKEMGIIIPEGKSDYRSGYSRLVYAESEREFRSRSALHHILDFKAKILSGETINDWRVAQRSVANMLEEQGFATEVRYFKDEGIDVIALRDNRRIAAQVKSKKRGVGPGDVRDFSDAVKELEKKIGKCTPLLVSTVGLPSDTAIKMAKERGISCLHNAELGSWLDKFVGQSEASTLLRGT